MPSVSNNNRITIDLFAGGGGASEGIEWALGVPVDDAVNHDVEAIMMHQANHKGTRHWCEDVWKVNPIEVAAGRPVGLLWASPDCTHHSRAKGGKPVTNKRRGLAWSIVKWARLIHPQVIILENVMEFAEWGPTIKKEVPVKQYYFQNGKKYHYKIVEYPDPAKRGTTFRLWMNNLRGLGYNVEYRFLSAADYGAPTIRKRLFLIARCDGQPIIWPAKTHGPGLLPYRTAAECIDWSIPCPSIFERKKELADNTKWRIAKGIRKFVIEAKEPFIVRPGHFSNISGEGLHFRGQSLIRPLSTITSKNDKMLCVPVLAKYHKQKGEESRCEPPNKPLATIDTQNRFALVATNLLAIDHKKGNGGYVYSSKDPLRTITTENRFALVSAFLSKFYTTSNPCAGLKQPMPTVTAIDHNALVTSHLTKFYGTNIGSDMREPVPTVTATGQHIGEVRAFLIKYYGCGVGQKLSEPMHTAKSHDTFGLVTIEGQKYQIADIGLRMLTPRELARAMSFKDSYILTGSTSCQVAKIGNSVPPVMAEVLTKANVKFKEIQEVKAG